MTRKLFYEDIHMTHFKATVVSCEAVTLQTGSKSAGDKKEPLYRLLLDATAFFPEEGGQSADIGTINGQDVLDVQIENDLIYHMVKEPFPVGETVEGHVDWQQRFDFMQQHSGEHILSGIIHTRFGYNNVGFHLSTREVTMDFDGILTGKQLRDIEHEANRVIWLNLPIEISYPTGDELSALDYRSKIEIDGQVRIVTIPGVDVCACCAPHTETTGQIGLIKIVSAGSYKGGVRLTILCGERALNDYYEKHQSITSIAQSMSVKQEQAVEAFEKLKTENLSLKETANTLQSKCLSMALDALPAPSESAHAVLFTDITDNIAIRNAVNDLTGRYEGYCAIFSGSENNYRFIVGSKHLDCNEIAQKLRTGLGAKCGGNALMIQGSVGGEKREITRLFH
ncbi:MAG: alanyl-tRNA editing protein [Lachnospiraceae bacterium]|nr:alanyl-tRNA editing protein [Lachnospiraceae bacterium]